MKKLLFTLFALPLLLSGQTQDPCHSINNYNTLLLEINPNIPTELPSGWSMFGYPCVDSTDAIIAFEKIADKIIIVKDEWGLSYLPEWEFNALGSLKFSEGYQIKLTAQVSDFSFCESIVLPTVEGCVDCQALNFDPWATTDDGSCHYDSDGDGVNDADELEGCMDSEACNYDPEATDEDGSCISVEDPACVFPIYCGATILGSTAEAQNNYGGDAPDHLFKFEATASMSYEISTCGSDFDTYLRVYDENMTELYSGDDTGDCSNKTILNVLLDPATYFILVEGYSTASGDYSLSVQSELSLSGYDCEGNLPPLQVGMEMEAEGGVVFHIDHEESKAYVVAYEDVTDIFSWGCEGLEIGDTDDAIGWSEANSQAIVDACHTSDCAAYQATEYYRYEINDWFLPTISELEKIYEVRELLSAVDGFDALQNDYYWSSSEVDLDHAKSFDFYMGAETTMRKYTNKPVRPVRVINF